LGGKKVKGTDRAMNRTAKMICCAGMFAYVRISRDYFFGESGAVSRAEAANG
jgi:hypothetical protein